MVGVEALDELLAMHVLLILGTSIPEMRVPVDHENLFAVLGLEHRVFPFPVLFLTEAPDSAARRNDECHPGEPPWMPYS
jgi:hypothetical protein